MKIVISSYKTNGDSLGLFEVKGNGFSKLSSVDILSPSFVVSKEEYVYTYEKSDVVTLYSYKIEANNLKVYDKTVIPGTSVTHLAYSRKNNLLIGCCYADGTYFSIGLKNGKFGKLYTYSKQIEDKRLSRCHAVLLNKEETTVAIVNIALDQIYIYDILNNELKFKLVIDLPVGSGPRHAIYNEDSSLMYVITEYSNEMIIIDMETNKIIQKTSTVPNFKGTTNGATLFFSKDNKYLFGSNRGEDSIAKFVVFEDGSLKYVKSFSCFGNHPRHMVISKDGKFIISCNKNSNNVAVINIEKEELVVDIPFENVTGVDIIE